MEGVKKLTKQKKQQIQIRNRRTYVRIRNAPKRNLAGVVIYNARKEQKKRTTSNFGLQQSNSPIHCDVNVNAGLQFEPAESPVSGVDVLLSILDDIKDSGILPKQHYQPWSVRREKKISKWKDFRETMFDIQLGKSAPPDATIACNDCSAKESIIRCFDCAPEIFLCEECDVKRHRFNVFHDREFAENGHYVILGPRSFVEFDGTNLAIMDRDNFVPLKPLDCENCGTDTDFYYSTFITCIVVTIRGRYDAAIPQFKCSKCQLQKLPCMQDICLIGLWPANPRFSQGMYFIATECLNLFDLLKKENPSLSVRGFLSVLQMLSNARNRSDCISPTAFSDALKEWRYCQFELEKLRGFNWMECSACQNGMHSCHVDGNKKLYRYGYNKSENVTNYYGSTFIEDDLKVDSFVKTVTSHKVHDGGNTCGESHWKAAKAASKTMAKLQETGLVMACCRHNILYKAVNMFQGEIYAYPLYLQQELRKHIISFFCQDVICRYWPWMLKVLDKSEAQLDTPALTQMKPFLSVMHGKAHDWACQIKYSGRSLQEAALSTGEEMEQVNAYMSRTGFTTKTMTRQGRLEELTIFASHWNKKKLNKIEKTLVDKYKKVICNQRATELSFKNTLQRNSVSVTDVKKWKQELLQIANDHKSREKPMYGQNKLAEMYMCRHETLRGEHIQAYTDGHQIDSLLTGSSDFFRSLKEKANVGNRTREKYDVLKNSLIEETGFDEDQLLGQGRKEAARIKAEQLQGKIEMTADSIRLKEYDLYMVKDSSTQRSRLRQRIAKDKTALQELVRDYNTIVSACGVEMARVSQNMIVTTDWPWIKKGLTSIKNMKVVVAEYDNMNRLAEERLLLSKEMKSVCEYLIGRIKELDQDIDYESLTYEQGRYSSRFINENSRRGLVGLRKESAAYFRHRLQRSVFWFEEATSETDFFSVQSDSEVESDTDNDWDNLDDVELDVHNS